MKRLLAYSAYYEPEIASSLYLCIDIYETFAMNGWDVDLIVPIPTRGVSRDVRKKYKKKRFEKKINGKLKIYRILLPNETRSVLQRFLRYILMNFIFTIKSLSLSSDVIFVQSTPPTQGFMAAIIKKIKKIPFVYNLQDVFPDSLVSTGLTKNNSFLFKIGRIIEDFTYRNADHIIVISNDMKKNIQKKGVPEHKISVVSNWIDFEHVKPIPLYKNYLYEKYSIDKKKFNIVYAGNLGYAQNIEVIIKSAELLIENTDIQFLIFGKGIKEEYYKNMAKNIKNISFFPIQPYSEVSYVYSLGSASIVSCKKGFGESSMPSKIWSIMATGTPVLASFDKNTEMENIIKNESVGLFSSADDYLELASNIKKLYNDKSLIDLYGENARNYIVNNFKKNIGTQKYMDIVMKILN